MKLFYLRTETGHVQRWGLHFKGTVWSHTGDNWRWPNFWGLFKERSREQLSDNVSIPGLPGIWMAYSKPAMIFNCPVRYRFFKDANTGKAACELEQQPLRSSMPSKLLAPLGNSLRPCAEPRVKSSLHLGDIGSQVERKEQRHSLQSCSALPDSRCSGLDVDETAASRMAAGPGELCPLSGYS